VLWTWHRARKALGVSRDIEKFRRNFNQIARERDQGSRRVVKWLTDSFNPFATGERQYQGMTIAKLHDKARRAVEAGEHKFREAAECLAAVRRFGRRGQR
jgi:hypothetical protein